MLKFWLFLKQTPILGTHTPMLAKQRSSFTALSVLTPTQTNVDTMKTTCVRIIVSVQLSCQQIQHVLIRSESVCASVIIGWRKERSVADEMSLSVCIQRISVAAKWSMTPNLKLFYPPCSFVREFVPPLISSLSVLRIYVIY